MDSLTRHPVIAYFVLANLLTWWMFPLCAADGSDCAGSTTTGELRIWS